MTFATTTSPKKSAASPFVAARDASRAPLIARVDISLAFGRYTLALPRDGRSRLTLGWFGLGVAALAASDILAVLLVMSRTPGLARLFPVANFFRAAPVAHVDLSVLVWFTVLHNAAVAALVATLAYVAAESRVHEPRLRHSVSPAIESIRPRSVDSCCPPRGGAYVPTLPYLPCRIPTRLL